MTAPQEYPHWTLPERALPTEGQSVEWMDGAGRVSYGEFANGMWWILDEAGKRHMYIYYVPQFWRPAPEWGDGG